MAAGIFRGFGHAFRDDWFDDFHERDVRPTPAAAAPWPAPVDEDDPDDQIAAAEAGDAASSEGTFQIDALARDLFAVVWSAYPGQFRGGEFHAAHTADRVFHGQPIDGAFRCAWFAMAAAAAAILTGRDLDVPTPIGRLFVGARDAADSEVEVLIDWNANDRSSGELPDQDDRADGQIVGPWFTHPDDAPSPSPTNGRPTLSVVPKGD